jgi:integrase
MAGKKRRRRGANDLPPGARRTSSGRITITMRDRHDQRRSHSKIKPDEPETYATPDEAWEGFTRVRAFLASEVDYVQTVAGFARLWTDEDDPVWGTSGTGHRGRGHGIHIYGSKLRIFFDRFAHRAVASISDADLLKWERECDVPLSTWPPLNTFFNDAAKAGLRVKGDNPVGERANNARARLSKAREQRKAEVPYVSKAEAEAMLTHLKMPRYPRSFYGWMLTAVRTGMRGSEVDGMELEHLDGDAYYIQSQLHPRTNRLDEPKHGSRRWISLPSDVLDEIERQRERNGEQADSRFIWTNTEGNPWRQSSREKWFEKRVAGTSACEIVGGRTMYEATRHHWASRVVNEGILPLAQAARVFGHSDHGVTLAKFYIGKDDNQLDAMREAQRRLAS